MLRIEPSALRECELTPGEGVEVEVAWDATSAGAGSTRVWVKAPKGENKLWTAGGATGRQRTGTWTFPGTLFTLDDGHGRVLARLTVPVEPCK
jgi:hypothetical protein